MRNLTHRGYLLAVLAGVAVAIGLLALWSTTWRAWDPQPGLPLRAAFYYPWYPENWGKGPDFPDTVYTPLLGPYHSSDAELVRTHISAMQYAHISAGILSWWGQNTATNRRIPKILAATSGSTFRWAIYYEGESVGDPSVPEIRDDLRYLQNHYGGDPSYLRINERFVVFVYSDEGDGCDMASRWSQANARIHAYIVLRVFYRYRDCAAQPDGWHQYAPANPADQQGDYSYTISPGFRKRGEDARLARDPERWRQDIQDMIASHARFQLITSFNEWGEGTAVEPASEWASPSGYGVYLDALHDDGTALALGP